MVIGKNQRMIGRFQQVHGDRYDYSQFLYTKIHDLSLIVCRSHGPFKQSPANHEKGRGCRKCIFPLRALSTEEWVNLAKIIYPDDNFDFSLVNYKDCKTKVNIICNKHGKFEIIPEVFLVTKQGCKLCNKEKKETIRISGFKQKALLVHDNLYNYDLVVSAKNTNEKVPIICPVHGIFHQTIKSHFEGKGCPTCKLSKGELAIKYFLNKKNIEYLREYSFRDCRLKEMLKFDFFIPKFDLIIEYDGLQHYIPSFTEESFLRTQMADEIKNNYCVSNRLNLMRIHYKNLKQIEEILTNLFEGLTN